MSVRASQSHKRWLSALPTARVRDNPPPTLLTLAILNRNPPDANLFKEAFEKAQSDNEALFPKEAGEGSAE